LPANFLKEKEGMKLQVYNKVYHLNMQISSLKSCNWCDIKFQEALLTDREVDVTGISTVLFDVSVLHGRYNDQIYNYKLSLSHMLCDIFHTNS
jgi:hypothetical protein